MKLARIVLVLAALAGCKQATKVDAVPVGPTQFPVIPAGSNPNTIGVHGAVGNRLQSADGLQAWVMNSSGTWVADPTSGSSLPDGGVLSTSFFETGSLDMTQTGTTTLVPAVAGKHWRTDQFRFNVATNTVAVTASQTNIGTNSPAFDNLVAAWAIGGAYPAGASYQIPSTTTFPVVNVGTSGVIINRAQAASDTLSVSWQIWGEYY